MNGGRKLKCDCSNYEDTLQTCDKILNTTGIPDIVINCAGAGDWKFLDEMDEQEINMCIGAPLMASVHMCRHLLPDMKKKNTGHLVFVQSPASVLPWSSCTMYSVSRWGMRGLSSALRADLDGTNIKITEVFLGKTKSSYFVNNPITNSRIPSISKMIGESDTSYAAREIIWAVSKKKELHSAPLMLRLLMFLHGMFPYLVKKIVFRYDYRESD